MAERQPSKLHVASSNLVSRSTSAAPATGDGAAAGDGAPARIADGAIRLRAAIGRVIRADPALIAAAAALSEAYRAGAAPANPAGHLHDARSAAAYAASRMPATFAAAGRALSETARSMPGFSPRTLLDVGAGTGATAWAAAAVWPGLEAATLLERDSSAMVLGRRLAGHAASRSLVAAEWTNGELETADLLPADVVTAAYVLGELDERARPAALARLWAATLGVLVLVEPGSRAGFERIRAARAALIEIGGRVAAPCPNDAACPIVGAAWCHFLVRLDRSPLQRRAKGAERSWEDEPFSYVAVTRPRRGGLPAAPDPAPRIVLGRPRRRAGVIELRICAGGRIETRTLSRRDGPAWKAARRLGWGDRVPAGGSSGSD